MLRVRACVRGCRFSLAMAMGNRGGDCSYAAPGQRRGSASRYRKKAGRKQWRQTGALVTNITEQIGFRDEKGFLWSLLMFGNWPGKMRREQCKK